MSLRTLAWYQPFGGAMLHGKEETRLVKKGKKAPFPLGKYMGYITPKKLKDDELLEMCWDWQVEQLSRIESLYPHDFVIPTETSMMFFTADLVNVRLMEESDELNTYVTHIDRKKALTHDRWLLKFENLQRIERKGFVGKQGIGFIDESEITYL